MNYRTSRLERVGSAEGRPRLDPKRGTVGTFASARHDRMRLRLRRRSVLVAAVALATVSAGMIGAGAHAASAATSVTGQITGMDGKCLGAARGDTANGTRADMYACVGDATHQWTFPGDGTIRTGCKCLDVANAGTADGTAVQMYDCNTTVPQQWVYSAGRDLLRCGLRQPPDPQGLERRDHHHGGRQRRLL